MIQQTHDNWMKEARSRFGDDPMDFAFICPRCKRINKISEFKERGAKNADAAAVECIGRYAGVLNVKSNEDFVGPGCDWVAYGLFGTMGFGRTIIIGDKRVEVFDFAPAQP